MDDVVPDDIDTMVDTTSATQQKDAYALQDTTIPGGSTINSVRVYFRFTGVNIPLAYAQPFLRLGTTETTGTEIENDDGYTTYSEILARPGGGDWAVSDLNDLQVCIGIRGVVDADTCDFTQIYVEVDYTLSVAEEETRKLHFIISKLSRKLKFCGNERSLKFIYD